MPINPFQWLGIDPQNKNPSHFELLGLPPDVPDEAEFAQRVRVAAQDKLQRLSAPELVKHGEVVDKLQRRIQLAANVLLDPRKRKAYFDQLPPVSPTLPQTTRLDRESSRTTAPGPVSPPITLSIGPPGKRPPSTPSEKPITPPTSRLPSLDEIPVAIPLGKVLPATSPPPDKPEHSPIPATTAHDPAQTSSDVDLPLPVTPQTVGSLIGTELELPHLSVNPATRRIRKRQSPLLMIGICIFVLLAISALTIVTFTLSNRPPESDRSGNQAGISETLDPLGQPQDGRPPNTMAETLKGGSNLRNALDDGLDQELTLDPLDTTRLLKDEPSGDDSLETGSLLQTPENTVGVKEGERLNPETIEKLLGASRNEKNARNTMPQNGHAAAPAGERNQFVMPAGRPDPEQLEMRTFFLEKSFRDLQTSFRRYAEPTDSSDANSHGQRISHTDRLNHLHSYFKILAHDAVDREPQLDEIHSLIDAYEEAFTHLELFWQQFDLGISKLNGGETFTLNDRELVFVEYETDHLTVRDSGRNLRYHRGFLPFGLAEAIAIKHDIEDVPSYRFQFAAYLASQRNGHVRYRNRIDQLLARSVADGHDATRFQMFLVHLSSRPKLSKKLPLPNSATQEKVLKSLSQSHRQSLRERQPEIDPEGDENELILPDFRGRSDGFWLDYLALDFNSATVVLNQLVLEAISNRDSLEAIHAASELGVVVDLELIEFKLATLSSIAVQPLDALQTRQLKEAAEPLLNHPKSRRELTDLADRLRKLITALDSKHQLQGTGQTMGALR